MVERGKAAVLGERRWRNEMLWMPRHVRWLGMLAGKVLDSGV